MQKAFELFRKAAKLGNSCAQFNVALTYEYGDGTKKNMDEAIYWYKISAKKGNEGAQSRLKEILEE